MLFNNWARLLNNIYIENWLYMLKFIINCGDFYLKLICRLIKKHFLKRGVFITLEHKEVNIEYEKTNDKIALNK